MRIRSTSTLRATHGTSTGAEPASQAHGGASTGSSTAAAAHPRSLGWHGAAPALEATASAGLSAAAPPGRPIQRALDQPAAQQGGGVPAAGRRPHCVGSPHTPAPLSPIRWTIMGGLNRMDINGQGAGWTKCSGWLHRTDRRLTGFSTTWVGCGRRIGSGRVVGVRGGTLRGPGGWRRRRLAGGTSGWRGMCRCSRLGIGAPPKKMILRRFGMWSGGVGRGRTRGGRLTGSRRAGVAPGRRSRASSDCLTRARATWRCGWRSATRSAKCCRGRCEDVANADTDDEQIDRGQPEWGFRWSAPLPAAAMADQLSRRNWIAQ